MLIYQKCGCGCEVRPLQIGGAHTCVCAPKSGRARCVRATQKTVATHTLVFTNREYRFVIYWLMDLPVVGYYGRFTYKHPIIIL